MGRRREVRGEPKLGMEGAASGRRQDRRLCGGDPTPECGVVDLVRHLESRRKPQNVPQLLLSMRQRREELARARRYLGEMDSRREKPGRVDRGSDGDGVDLERETQGQEP